MSKESKLRRRKLRKEKNIRKLEQDKIRAKEAGRIIEENHNGGPYSINFCNELSDILCKKMEITRNIRDFQCIKDHMRNLVVKWNPDLPYSSQYFMFKELLEIYWDSEIKDNETWGRLYDKFRYYNQNRSF